MASQKQFCSVPLFPDIESNLRNTDVTTSFKVWQNSSVNPSEPGITNLKFFLPFILLFLWLFDPIK